jgi:SAM-dependent methyltransferase
MHGDGAPSPWITRFAGLIAPGGRVLDLACGSGRHVRWLAAQGFAVTGVDRDAQALAPLQGIAEILIADLEGAAWPLPGRCFDGIVVTNYLWRALWPELLSALEPGGVLLYETFADGQQHFGRPSRPEFLLRRGELLQVCASLRIVAYEDGFQPAAPRCVQRIAAVREGAQAVAPQRLSLAGPGG